MCECALYGSVDFSMCKKRVGVIMHALYTDYRTGQLCTHDSYLCEYASGERLDLNRNCTHPHFLL